MQDPRMSGSRNQLKNEQAKQTRRLRRTQAFGVRRLDAALLAFGRYVESRSLKMLTVEK